MIQPEPGPIARVEPPAPIDLFAGPVFEPLIESTLGTHAAGELALSQAALDVGAGGVPDVDTDFASTVSVAEASTADELAAGIDQAPYEMLATGGGVDVHQAAVLPYLPQADTSVPEDFQSPPALPSLDPTHTGSNPPAPDEPHGDEPPPKE